ncbi:DUF4129 domain-containing protein [Paenibacillus sp. CC-CFT747]|nr:DUF4129 domain-containing protein [Paenibacillus sp. CC-CFT747]
MVARYRQPASLNHQLIQEYNKLMRSKRRKGFTVYEHETARETLSRWMNKDAWLSKDLEQLLALFEKAKYSSRPITPEEMGRASTLFKRLREEL